jgi:hypothetical protein
MINRSQSVNILLSKHWEQGRTQVELRACAPFGFWKIVFFGNLSSPEIFFIENKIFNIVHNEIIMQRYQNIKFHLIIYYFELYFIIILIYKILLF